MTFEEELASLADDLAEVIETLKERLATKHSLVLPFEYRFGYTFSTALRLSGIPTQILELNHMGGITHPTGWSLGVS